MEVKKKIVCVLCCSNLSLAGKPGKINGSVKSPEVSLPGTLQNGEVSSSLCGQCKSLVSSAVASKAVLEETERDVRRRQMELLAELRNLEAQVTNFKMWMGEINQVVNGSSKEMLEGELEDNGVLEEEQQVEMQNRDKVFKWINKLQECHKRIFSTGNSGILKPDNVGTKPTRKTGPGLGRSLSTTNSPGISFSDMEPETENVKVETDSLSVFPDEQVTVKMEVEVEPTSSTNVSYVEEVSGSVSNASGIASNPATLEEDSLFLGIATDQEFQNVSVNHKNRSSLKTKSPSSFSVPSSKAQCPICGKWMHVSSVRNHSLTHTREKPYKCQYCTRCYRQKSALNVHMLVIHSRNTRGYPVPKPTYTCHLCGLDCKYKSNLNSHLRKIHKSQAN